MQKIKISLENGTVSDFNRSIRNTPKPKKQGAHRPASRHTRSADVTTKRSQKEAEELCQLENIFLHQRNKLLQARENAHVGWAVHVLPDDLKSGE